MPVNKVHQLTDTRADYDLKTVHSIINQCMSLHVCFAPGGSENEFPTVIPMIGAMGSFDRPSADIGEPLDCYIHGYISARMANLAREKMAQGHPGLPVCVSATKIDGIVLALSFAHSCNYRSASLFGYASLVTDTEEKLWALERITNGLVAGRWEGVRQPPSANELLQTQVLRIRVQSGSAKVRAGPVVEVREDLQELGNEKSGLVGVYPFGRATPGPLSLEV